MNILSIFTNNATKQIQADTFYTSLTIMWVARKYGKIKVGRTHCVVSLCVRCKTTLFLNGSLIIVGYARSEIENCPDDMKLNIYSHLVRFISLTRECVGIYTVLYVYTYVVLFMYIKWG